MPLITNKNTFKKSNDKKAANRRWWLLTYCSFSCIQTMQTARSILRNFLWNKRANWLYQNQLALYLWIMKFCCQIVATTSQNRDFYGSTAGKVSLRNYSHSLTSSFPQLLFALFWANFREISLVLLRFSLYSLCSQPVWYCFGIKVWYQFSEKSAEKNFVILFQ